MNRSSIFRTLLVAFAVLLAGHATSTAATIFDDFDDGALNAVLWAQTGSSGMLESGTEVRFSATPLRNTLSSLATFDPTNDAVTITGRVRVANNDGHFMIFTRVNPTTDGTINGFYHNGLYATLNNQSNVVTLNKIQNKAGTQIASQSFAIANGDVYDFIVTDDGTTLSATFTQFSGANPGSTTTISDNSFTFTPSATSDRVGFTHREGRQDFLDFVTITDDPVNLVPEPQTGLLAVVGIMGVCLLMRNRISIRRSRNQA